MLEVIERFINKFALLINFNFSSDGRSSYPSLKDGGALQISVQGFQVDYYPYHLAKADRAHWPK